MAPHVTQRAAPLARQRGEEAGGVAAGETLVVEMAAVEGMVEEEGRRWQAGRSSARKSKRVRTTARTRPMRETADGA